jgi:hypothetical protein
MFREVDSGILFEILLKCFKTLSFKRWRPTTKSVGRFPKAYEWQKGDYISAIKVDHFDLSKAKHRSRPESQLTRDLRVAHP